MSVPKQIIVLRKDLNMRKGKMVAQGAHASLAVILQELEDPKKIAVAEWLNGLQTKICVSVNSEAELIALYERAKLAGLPCSLIKDAGLTEFNEPTYTAVAIGPAYPEQVNVLTGNLPLL